MKATLALLLLVWVSTPSIAAPEGTQLDIYAKDCPERTALRWCRPMLKEQGWQLKYAKESPRELMDKSYIYEVWVKDEVALVCLFEGGRGGIGRDDCISIPKAASD
jgi:hypothetical protein